MKLLYLKPLLLFLVTWILSFLLLIIDWGVIISFSVPAIFGIFYLIKGLYKLTVKLSIEDLSFIIIGALLIATSIKLFYIYYNFLILLILLVLAIFYSKKYHYKIKPKVKYLINFLITLNIILLFTPDNFIFSKINQVYSNKIWSSKISWKDFEGKQIDSSKYSAQIITSLNYKINEVFNYPQVIIISVMDKEISWKKESIYSNNIRLLKHEQGHFDIAKIQTNKAIDSINNSWPLSYKNLSEIIIHFSKTNGELTNTYDKYTRHSQDTIYQKVFDSLFDSELRNK